MSDTIEALIAAEDWEAAEALIRSHLAFDPDCHWLLTRLSTTFYERRQYGRALHYAERALRLAPRCPLVLWDYAGSLDMLGQKDEAIVVFRRLIRRGAIRIARGPCGEGLARSRALVADCWYRVALCHRDLGHFRPAVRALRKHLSLRGAGCRSIYSIREVQRTLADLKSRAALPKAPRRSGPKLPQNQHTPLVGRGEAINDPRPPPNRSKRR